MKRKKEVWVSLAVFLLSLSSLTGCATLSKKECLNGDWMKIGEADGMEGYSSEKRLEAHEAACAEYQVPVDRVKYDIGWEKGILRYCVPSKGYILGEKLSPYPQVCPPDQEKGFLSGYREGLETARRNSEWEYREEKESYLHNSMELQRLADKKQVEALEKKIAEKKAKVEELEKKIRKIHRLQTDARARELALD